MDCAFEAADVVAHLDEPVDRVELGQRMIITRSGMPVGALVPFAEEARQRRP
ncbi:MAG: type II toxin-antitoxin system prevent-host-death family antitoxin [Chloroflexota bacterium]